MPNTIKKLSIAGTDTKSIGAEAQDIEVSYDSNGDIISDITAPGIVVDHTDSLSNALKNAPIKNHASTTTEYGVASEAYYGHMKVGTGLKATNGLVEVKYGTTADTATKGDDSRLSNPRRNPNPVTFSDGTNSVSYDGSAPRTILHSTVGAAPKNHVDSTPQYGLATKLQYGHVRLGDGLDNRDSLVTLTPATINTIGGVKVDGDSITVDTDGTLHGAGSGGSSISITTLDPILFNQNITITAEKGADPVIITFDDNGYTEIKGYMGTGAIKFACNVGGRPAESTISIPYFGNYSTNIEFWTATITLTTPTADMFGQPIVVKDSSGLIVGNETFNNAGVANCSVHNADEYTFECTLGWRTFKTTARMESENIAYTGVISGFVSNITLSTSTPEFANSLITISGTSSESGVTIPSSALAFNNSQASYKSYAPGTYVFTVHYEGQGIIEDVVETVYIGTQGNYSKTIDLDFTATAHIVANDDDFNGRVIQIERLDEGNFVPIGTTTFDNARSATYKVHKAATYRFSVTNSD